LLSSTFACGAGKPLVPDKRGVADHNIDRRIHRALYGEEVAAYQMPRRDRKILTQLARDRLVHTLIKLHTKDLITRTPAEQFKSPAGCEQKYAPTKARIKHRIG